MIFLLLPAALALPPEGTAWELLQDKPVRVECATVAGEPWCRSFGLIGAPVDQVGSALKDMRHSADLFQSVLSIDVLPNDVLHITLDYPAPLADRDYVARYSAREEGAARIFTWVPATDPGAPETDAAVRLPAFAGEWRLEPREGGTWVRYTWQAQINGKFPAWGYNIAWKRAGFEALRDLARTRGADLETSTP